MANISINKTKTVANGFSIYVLLSKPCAYVYSRPKLYFFLRTEVLDAIELQNINFLNQIQSCVICMEKSLITSLIFKVQL